MIPPVDRHSGPLSKALGVSLGPLIDSALHFDVCQRSAALMMPKHRDHYLMFGSAWNGVGVRLKAAAIHGAAYRQLFDAEPASSHDVRFEQDMRLFDGIANAVSAAENALFSAYLLSVFPAVPEPAGEALMQSRHRMLDHIAKAERTTAVGSALRKSFGEQPARATYQLRDFLLHRGRPSRNHFVGGEFDGKATIARNIKAHASVWQNDLVIDRDLLDASLEWVSEHCATTAKGLAAAM